MPPSVVATPPSPQDLASYQHHHLMRGLPRSFITCGHTSDALTSLCLSIKGQNGAFQVESMPAKMMYHMLWLAVFLGKNLEMRVLSLTFQVESMPAKMMYHMLWLTAFLGKTWRQGC